MTISTHLVLALIGVLLGFAAGFFGLGFCVLVYLKGAPRLAQPFVMFICGILGFWTVKKIFTKIIRARCPSCRTGKAFPIGTWEIPIVYVCSNCGYRETRQVGLSSDV